MTGITIKELEAISRMLFRHIKHQKGGDFELNVPKNYQWSIPREERLDMSACPKQDQMTVNDLDDCIYELRRIINREADPFSYAFVWLASLLIELGETEVS